MTANNMLQEGLLCLSAREGSEGTVQSQMYSDMETITHKTTALCDQYSCSPSDPAGKKQLLPRILFYFVSVVISPLISASLLALSIISIKMYNLVDGVCLEIDLVN